MLVGGIAHDFNHFLAAILASAQLAKRHTARTSAAHRHLAEIERASLHAADLCKQILAYSRQDNIEDIKMRRLDLNQIIRDMSGLLRVSASKQARLEFHLARDLPGIRGDAGQLRQIVMNLVINASEAIGGAQGTISLSTGTIRKTEVKNRAHETAAGQPPPGDSVFMKIADTGHGMDDATKARIFDPFFTTKSAGRGLGLAAVLGIVRSHGGTLEVASRQGEGTAFTLLFPREEPARAARPEEEENFFHAKVFWKASREGAKARRREENTKKKRRVEGLAQRTRSLQRDDGG